MKRKVVGAATIGLATIASALVVSKIQRPRTPKPGALLGTYSVDLDSNYFDNPQADARIKRASIVLNPGGVASLKNVPEGGSETLFPQNLGSRKVRWSLVRSEDKWVVRFTPEASYPFDFDLWPDEDDVLGTPLGDPDEAWGVFFRKVK